ncbi:MAG: AgmX/PglI C-terminal domain-containing protein [Bdellovibrionales bacterium]|nr:AgmX/PglI C-terminal domain-containing protein [Bdellovibrionales bacterium]
MSGMGGNKDDFLITTTVEGKSWHWLWDHDEPMTVDHPSEWELHRDTHGGAKFVHRISKKEIEVKDAHLTGAHDLSIPADGAGGRELNIHFKKLHRIRPAYLSDLDALKNVGPADHYASAGIREHLISFKPVDKTIHCKVEDDEMFEVRSTPSTFVVVVKRAGVRFKPHGESSRVLNPGAPIQIPFSEMYGGAFIYGSYWWRFNKVPTPEMMDLDELDREESAQDVVSLNQLGKFTLGIVAVLFGLIQAAHYMELYQDANRKKPETAVVELKKPKLIPLAEKPKPTPAPPKKIAEKPKPTPAPPKKVAKKEPPKKPEKKIVKKPEPKRPVPKKIVKHEPPPKPVPVVKHAPPAAPAPVVKHEPVKPKAPDPSVIAAQQRASVAKSLNFLSTGPSKNVNALATAPNGKMAQKYEHTGSGAVPASNSALNALAKSNTGSGPISTSSSRTVASNSGIKGGHGKGLNQVQGKVSLNALYGSGSGEALGAAMGGGMTVSGPGSLSDADIEKTLAKYLQKLQFCYEKALLSDSSLGGVIQIKWTITASGSVNGQSVVRSEMNNAGLHTCLMKEFAKMHFPKPKGGEVQVKKPFKFEASAM